MSNWIRDIHCSGLRFVEAIQDVTPSKYNRISIPYNPNRKCLGYLEGPAASLTEETRNGRGYILKLWKNVQDSEAFREGMENAVIVGELDHPEERVDYSLTKGSVILTDFEIREDEGIVWTRFAILDNDQGKILMSYVQFGSILGVSSRGLGDEIIQNGKNIIDPDTYEFYCFDVVAFPAAAVARQSFQNNEAVVESVEKAFSDRVIEEANSCKDINSLQNLKYVVESTNVANKSALVDAISNKLSSLSESTDDQSNAGEEDDECKCDKEKEILLGKLASTKAELDKQLSENATLKEALKCRNKTSSYFRRALQEREKEANSLEIAVEDGLTSMSQLSKELNVTRESYTRRERKLRAKLESRNNIISTIRETNDSSLDMIHSLECRLNAANSIIAERESKLESLIGTVKSLKADRATLRHSLTKARKEAVNARHKLRESGSSSTKKLTESTGRQKATITSLRNNLNDLQKTNESLKAQLSSKDNELEAYTRKTNKMLACNSSLLESYLKRCCDAYGIEVETVKAELPKTYTQSTIDKTIKKLSERQQRIDMLTIAMPSRSGLVVEHNTHTDSDDNPSFLVEALRRGVQTTN